MPGREHVTILFTDLVGSTELVSALSPEAADELRRTHFSALRRGIATAGGTEVKNLGDGLMVTFSAASAALGGAVAMQQAVHRDNASAERPLGLRVGLSSGEATKEADDYFGDPVVEAARLCAMADAGQILATDLVRASAGRRSPHRFNSLGDQELKGLPEPIEVLEVDWDPLETEQLLADRVPFPARLAHRPSAGVVGRDEELASLLDTAKAVASGEGRALVLVAGEPGQGKTTLVSELARQVHDEGTTVLLGRCDEDMGVPYRPFFEALTHLVVHSDEALLGTHVSSHGAELSRLVPALGQRLGDLPPLKSADPDTERYLLYAAAVGLLDQASTQSPVLVVLDDLHWADKPSLQLLRHLVANTAATRLLVIGTYRDAELSAAHPLAEALGALHREPGVSALGLKGLDDTGVIAYMEARAGHDLDEATVGLAHQISRETDGNPYFVYEVLRELVESGAITQDATTGRWSAAPTEDTLVLPHSVRTVIGTRVARLGETATTVLATASVIGRDFDLELLTETTQLDEDTLLDLMDAARRAALVIELHDSPGHYSFTHALVQHTLSEDLGTTRRARMHRAVGEAIERLSGESDERTGELARHFFFATRPTEAAKAIAYARRAGEAALKALAPDEAVRYFSQALELATQSPTEPTARIDLGIGLGVAQRQAGSAEFRATLLEAARAARAEGDPARLARAALANTRGWFASFGQVDSERVEILEAALGALGDADTPEHARLLATLCAELNYGAPLARRLALADEAKAIARRLGDGGTFVDVVNRSSVALWAPSTLEMQLADHEEAEAIAVTRGLGDLLVASLCNVGNSLAVRAGRFDIAAERLATLSALAEKLRQPALRWAATCAAATQALLHGDVAEAERLATSALEIGTASDQPDAFSFYNIQLAAIRYEQGRIGELVSLIAAGIEQYPAVPGYKALLAVASLHGGDEATATALLDELAARSFAFPEDNTGLPGIIYCARVAVELERPDRAAPLSELLAPYHEQVPHNVVNTYEPVAMYLGALAAVLGHYDEAERSFEEATELNERGQMTFADAYTKMLWGRMLGQRGGRHAERGRDLLEQASSIATNRGYAWVERKAAEQLARLA